MSDEEERVPLSPPRRPRAAGRRAKAKDEQEKKCAESFREASTSERQKWANGILINDFSFVRRRMFGSNSAGASVRWSIFNFCSHSCATRMKSRKDNERCDFSAAFEHSNAFLISESAKNGDWWWSRGTRLKFSVINTEEECSSRDVSSAVPLHWRPAWVRDTEVAIFPIFNLSLSNSSQIYCAIHSFRWIEHLWLR